MGLKDDLKAIAKISKELKKLETENAQLATKIAKDMKGKVPIEFLVDGAIKSYKEAVKKSDGLTSMRPSVVKVLDTATVKPTKSAIAKGITDIKGHVTEVHKVNKDALKTR